MFHEQGDHRAGGLSEGAPPARRRAVARKRVVAGLGLVATQRRRRADGSRCCAVAVARCLLVAVQGVGEGGEGDGERRRELGFVGEDVLAVLVEERRGDAAGHKVGVVGAPPQETQVGGQARHLKGVHREAI